MRGTKGEDMSVETVGAQGSNYQYTITLYMALRHFEKDHFKVWVENTSFAEGLAHFQKLKSDCAVEVK